MIVVDSSALVDLLTGRPGLQDLRRRLTGEEVCAPTLMDYEVASVLRGLVLGGHLGVHRAEEALTDLDELPLHRWASSDGLRRRALQLRHNLSAYDAAYVALAEALQCPLVTRDARLARARGHDAVVEVH